MSKSQIAELLEGVEGVTPEFAEKVIVIFEAAVSEAVDAEIAQKTVSLTEASNAATLAHNQEQDTVIKAALDTALTEAVTDWVKENSVVLDSKLKGELAEGFITGLSSIIESFGVKFDDAAKDHVAELEKQLSEATTKLAEAETKLNESAESSAKAERQVILDEAVSSLVETKRDRIKKIMENMAVTDNEDFKKKLGIVVEAVVGVPGAKEDDGKKDDDDGKAKPGEGNGKKDDDNNDDGKGAGKDVNENTELDPEVAAILNAWRSKK